MLSVVRSSVDTRRHLITFFNNELDEATKNLIGDIAPKKIDIDSNNTLLTSTDIERSVWNSAGTFEECVHTPLLLGIVVRIPGCYV